MTYSSARIAWRFLFAELRFVVDFLSIVAEFNSITADHQFPRYDNDVSHIWPHKKKVKVQHFLDVTFLIANVKKMILFMLCNKVGLKKTRTIL